MMGTYHMLHKARKDQWYARLSEDYLDGEVPPTMLWINSSKAAALGIKDGDLVKVQSSLNGVSLQAQAKVTEAIHPDQVMAYSGWGRTSANMDPLSRAKQGLNESEFIPTNISPYTCGGAKYQAPVTVTKVVS